MSFIKFKLDSATERSAPIPIAAAVPRTSSRWRDGHVQDESPREVSSQESSVERICSTPSAITAHCKRLVTIDLMCSWFWDMSDFKEQKNN